MNEIQTVLLDMMIDVDKKLHSENIFYYLDSGNALGAVRHKGFIPWDDDIDICILRKDVKRFVKAIKSMDGYYLQEPYSIDWPYLFYKIRKNNTTAIEKTWVDTRMHQGLFIDVMVMEDYPNSKTARRLYDWIVGKLVVLGDLTRDHSPSKRDIIFSTVSIVSKILNVVLDVISLGDCDYVTQRTFFKSTNTYCKKYINNTYYADYETYQLPLPSGNDELLKMKYGDYMKLPPENKRVGPHLIFFSKDIDYREYLSKFRH